MNTADIRARAAAATPGPWEREDLRVMSDSGHTLVATVHPWKSDDPPFTDVAKADAVFIAAARLDVPWLCDRVDELAGRLSAFVAAWDTFQNGESPDTYGPMKPLEDAALAARAVLSGEPER